MKTLIKALVFLFKIFAFLVFAWVIFSLFTPAKKDRDWNTDQAVLPGISIDGNSVHIKNIRNFEYRSTTDYTPRYYDKTFSLDKIRSVDYMVEPFSGNSGAAHTLVSFGFDDGSYVAISVEIRKEKGESFSAVKGLLRQYELMYVIADERDVIKLRSNYRKDQVFLYPMKASREQARNLFLDMLARAQKLQDKPEMYNTLTSTCITNIISHVNKLSPDRVPWNKNVLFPANSDKYAYDLGLIDTDLSFEEARKKFNINERAEKYADSPQFSKMIRR
jgi:hypothetical protein